MGRFNNPNRAGSVRNSPDVTPATNEPAAKS
jgi:hypothetical protein